MFRRQKLREDGRSRPQELLGFDPEGLRAPVPAVARGDVGRDDAAAAGESDEDRGVSLVRLEAQLM